MANESYNKSHGASIDYVNSAIVAAWNAMKQYLADQSVEPDLKPLIMARLSALINRAGYNWQSIMEQVIYLEDFKAELQEVCEEKGMIVSNLELMQWISSIRMALGVFGTYIYAIDENDVEHFYTNNEWEVLKTQAEQGLITLPRGARVIVNNSSGTRFFAIEQPFGLAWGGYGLTLINMTSPAYDGLTLTRKLLQNLNPLVSKYYLDDPEVIIVEDYGDIDTSTAPTAYTWYVVVTSAGENTVAIGTVINRGTAESPKYEDVKSGEPEIGQTMETFTCQAYYWNGTTLTSKYQVPYKDSQNIYGSPAAEYCAKYKACPDDESLWYLGRQDEWQMMCANQAVLQVDCKAVLPTWVLSGWCWSSEQYNNNNAYYTNFPGGGTNYPIKNNTYYVVPFSVFRRGAINNN